MGKDKIIIIAKTRYQPYQKSNWKSKGKNEADWAEFGRNKRKIINGACQYFNLWHENKKIIEKAEFWSGDRNGQDFWK